MASPQALEWFDEYAQPRKMKKQIVNSYMVSRCIANKMNPGIPSEDSVFYKKQALEAYNSSQAVAV